MGRNGHDAYRRRGRPWMIGAGLVAVLVMGLVLGLLIGRASAPSSGPGATAGRPATAGVPGVGPGGVANGIPVGYERTALGAAQAAGNYLSALGGRLALDPVRLRAALDLVAEPSSRARLEQGLSASLDTAETLWGMRTAAQQGKQVVLTQTPIAYKVDSYTPDEATVRVWQVLNVGVENRQRLTAFFGIGSATLVWQGGDWRLRNIDAGSQAADVVPAILQTPTPTGGVPRRLEGFMPYGGG